MADETTDDTKISDLRQIDQQCDLFEQKFKAGETPLIADFLSTAPDSIRERLFAALLRVDFQLRRERGENPAKETYLEHFPGYETEINKVLQNEQTAKVASVADVSQLPGYEPIEVIGRGGMGVVYKATQLSTGRVVALKVLRDGLAVSDEALQRFRWESETVAQLRHPNIVQLFEAGDCQGLHYFSLEYCEQGSLRDRLNQGKMPVEETAALVVSIARAVHAAHEKRVVHRDLKPGNILIQQDGEPKVADFGLAYRETNETRFTSHGKSMGTPSYMAPEQIRGDGFAINATTDVYAIGVILYECLTGARPFECTNQYQLIETLNQSPPSLRSHNAKIPKDLETICLKCLEKESRDRYANAKELADDLERFQNGQPIRAKPTRPIVRLFMWARRNPWLALAMSLAACAMLVVAILSAAMLISEQQNAARLQVELNNTQRQVALATWDRGHDLCQQGNVSHGLLVLAKALSIAPGGEGDRPMRTALRRELTDWRRLCPIIEHVWKHPGDISAMAISPNGELLATTCSDNHLRIWNLSTAKLLKKISVGSPTTVAFAQGDDTIVTGDDSGNIQLWNATDYKESFEFTGVCNSVNSISVDQTGERLAVAGSNDKIAILDLSLRKAVAEFQFPGRANVVAFHPQKDQLLVGGGNDENEKGMLKLYDISTADEPRITAIKPNEPFDLPIRSIAFHPKQNDTILVGDEDWECALVDLTSGNRIFVTDAANGNVNAVAFSRSGDKVFIAAEESNDALIWSIAGLRQDWLNQKQPGAPLQQADAAPPLRLPHPQPVRGVLVTQDDTHFVTFSSDQCVRVWRRREPLPRIELPHHPRTAADENREFAVHSIAIESQGRFAVTGGEDQKLRFWNLDLQALQASVAGSGFDCKDQIRSLAIAGDGKTIAFGTLKGFVMTFSAEDRSTITSFPKQAYEISGMAFTPDGESLLAGGGGEARNWSLAGDEEMKVFSHGKQRLSLDVDISPDGSTCIIAGQNGIATLWNMNTGHRLRQLKHRNAINRGAFSNNSKLVVTGSGDKSARIWHVESGELLATLNHSADVYSATFLPGDEMVATGDRTGLHIWSLKYRRPIGATRLLKDTPMHIVCTADGAFVAAADWEGYGVVWKVPQPIQEPNVQQIIRDLQTDVGLRLDQGDGLEILTSTQWLELRDTK